MTATFAFQDGKWVLKSATVTNDGFSTGDGYFQSDLMLPATLRPVKAVRQRLKAAAQKAGRR